MPGGDVARAVVTELHAEEMLIGRFEAFVEVGGVVHLRQPSPHLIRVVAILDAAAQRFARQLNDKQWKFEVAIILF